MIGSVVCGMCRQCTLTRFSTQPFSHRSISTLRNWLRQQHQVKQLPVTRRASKSNVARLIQYARPERWRIVGAIGLLAISTSVTMSVPFCMGKVIDIISSSDGEDKNTLITRLTDLSKILITIFLIGGAANAGRVYIIRMAGQRITRDMRQNLFKAIMRQETAFFDRTRTGELVNRLSSDTTVVGEALTTNIADGLRSTVQVIGGVGMMLFVSAKLAVLSLGIVPILGGAMVFYGRYVKQLSRIVQNRLADATQVAEERISSLRTVRAFAQEDQECNRYNSQTEEVLKIAKKDSVANSIFFGATGLAGNVIALTVFYCGGLMMTEAEITVGDLSAFFLYAMYTGVSIGGINTFYSAFNRALGASSRIWEIMDHEETMEKVGGLVPASPLSGHIKFNNIHFAYPTRQDTPLFAGISLDVPAGSILALVGRSGSGKSTLGSLLLRLYEPSGGEICVDGVDIKDLDLKWWRHQIGTVSQEPILFSCSIAENIAYGMDDISPGRIEEVARQAHALEFIRELPQGFDTLVGERGVLLSGGQRQRVAIARAIIREPQFLLLDEATSALDSASEKMVQSALESVMKGRTVVTIAHRLSTIRTAHQVAVLDNGKVVEVGTYELLMNIEQGVFRHLVERQMLGVNS